MCVGKVEVAAAIKAAPSATVMVSTLQPKPPHLIVKALAGTGKTTTLIEGLKNLLGMPTNIKPSPQQQAIWDSLLLSRGAKSICITSLTNTIVDELRRRVPHGVEAVGMHSMGYRAVRKAFTLRSTDPINKHRTSDILAEMMERDIWSLRREKPVVVNAVISLLGYCKITLI